MTCRCLFCTGLHSACLRSAWRIGSMELPESSSLSTKSSWPSVRSKGGAGWRNVRKNSVPGKCRQPSRVRANDASSRGAETRVGLPPAVAVRGTGNERSVAGGRSASAMGRRMSSGNAATSSHGLRGGTNNRAIACVRLGRPRGSKPNRERCLRDGALDELPPDTSRQGRGKRKIPKISYRD
jgi:hypothetical protein